MKDLFTAIRTKRTAEGIAVGKKMFRRLASTAYTNIEVLPIKFTSAEDAILVREDNLGISMHVIPLLFHYAHMELQNEIMSESIGDITKCLLLCCPDHSTAWNNRKLMLANQQGNWFQREFDLTALVLKINPKSSETFAHRRWIFTQKCTNVYGIGRGIATDSRYAAGPPQSKSSSSKVLEPLILSESCRYSGLESQTHFDSLLAMIRDEVIICKDMSVRQRSNYNAWAHKSWVLDCLYRVITSTRHDIAIFLDKVIDFLKDDVLDMMDLQEKSVSDISISANLLRSLSTWTRLSLLTVNPHVTTLWNQVLQHNSRLIYYYESHECLWCHRRNLFMCHHRIIKNTSHSEDSSFSVEKEEDFCSDFTAKTTFAGKHLTFLNKFVWK